MSQIKGRIGTQFGPDARRRLAEGLRRAGESPHDQRPLTVLLCGRARQVAAELADLAEIVETVADPSPDWLLAVRELITDGLDSPLYDPSVHVSELRATLFYLARPSARVWQPAVELASFAV